MFDVEERFVLAFVELVDAHHDDVDLLRRVVAVELLAPQLSIHLNRNCSISEKGGGGDRREYTPAAEVIKQLQPEHCTLRNKVC